MNTINERGATQNSTADPGPVGVTWANMLKPQPDLLAGSRPIEKIGMYHFDIRYSAHLALCRIISKRKMRRMSERQVKKAGKKQQVRLLQMLRDPQ